VRSFRPHWRHVDVQHRRAQPGDDTDGDGIPNVNELGIGLDPLDPSDAALDADGDGMSNLQEFLAGTDPTNSASYLHITSVVRTTTDLRVTWMMGSGKTNALQVTTGDGFGNFATNNFADLFTATNTVGSAPTTSTSAARPIRSRATTACGWCRSDRIGSTSEPDLLGFGAERCGSCLPTFFGLAGRGYVMKSGKLLWAAGFV